MDDALIGRNERKILSGVFQASQRGFGFVVTDGEEQDVYIAEDNVNGAFHGDTVEYLIIKQTKGRRKEGKIVGILSRGTTKIVGLYEKRRNFGFVRPDNQKIPKDIYIPSEADKGAVTGHKVVAEITSYGKGRVNPEGKIIEIIGHVKDPGTDILSIVKEYGLPTEFSEKVLNQANRVGKEVSEADMAGRLDLRDMRLVTIDSEDAKDLDDAVSLTREGGLYKLGVHIADVANYVQEKSALDKEALNRGTSVYLADRVIPMLPHKLCNGICSLNAGEVRLALSCIMLIDNKGEVVDHRIAESVIKVAKRMSYTGVEKILREQSGNSGDMSESEKYASFVPMFLDMAELSGILRKNRRRRGSVDFDFPETRLVLDGQGKPLEIMPYERNTATDIIEDFMLLANETVAEEYFWREIPFLYRIHEEPEPEKIKKLSTFIHNFGYNIHVGNNKMQPKEIQKLLSKIEGTPHEALISRLALRSMKRARYTKENTGHFGLAAKYYTHFTSPIRRYPDLQIHRIIKEDLRGRLTDERMEHYDRLLTGVAACCSDNERKADEAERETVKLKKAEYMQSRIGTEYEGVISGITKWGLYVELENTVEGFIHVSNMYDDHYEYIESDYELVGIHTGRIYKLGQTIGVRVTDADKLRRAVEFELA